MLRLICLGILLVAVAGFPSPQESPTKTVRYCQPQTPCGWKIYSYVDYPEIRLTNEYCTCRPWQKCVPHKNLSAENYIEYRCRTSSGNGLY